MSPTRQDAWSQDEDLLLAEVVLQHLREGRTQLQAFEEVGKRLSRTASACGFRWNSTVRKKYALDIKTAKVQRKEIKRSHPNLPATMTPTSLHEEKDEIPFQTVIDFLQRLYQRAERSTDIQSSVAKIKELEKIIFDLTNKNEKLESNLKTIQEDYQRLLEIMERARKMVVLQD
jgi:RsfA family transcription factor